MKAESSIMAGVICVVVMGGIYHYTRDADLMWVCFIWWWAGCIAGRYLRELLR